MGDSHLVNAVALVGQDDPVIIAGSLWFSLPGMLLTPPAQLIGFWDTYLEMQLVDHDETSSFSSPPVMLSLLGWTLWDCVPTIPELPKMMWILEYSQYLISLRL